MMFIAFLILASGARAEEQKPYSIYTSYREMVAATNPKLATVVPVTKGPKFHWFSFYDLLQFDPSGRYILGMEVDFEDRSPKPEDEIGVGVIDLKEGNRWREIGRTKAWCWQEGCRLQWRPGSSDEVLWNERDGGRFVCRITNVRTGASRIVPHAIYNIAPDGRTVLTYPFERVAFRGYGFEGVPDQFSGQVAPRETGIFQVDLDTGASKLIIPLSKIAELRQPDPYPVGNLYLMQLEWNPSGSRFLMYSRRAGAKNLGTIVFTAAGDGSDLHRINRDLSHYAWKDDATLLFWDPGVKGYGLYQDTSDPRPTLLWEAPNGHQSYLPGREWIVTDTYPQKGIKHLYLYHVPTKSFVPLGRFSTPKKYQSQSEGRCDLHPRLSPDGRHVVVDSVHGGNGRQMYLLDIGYILDNPPDGGK